MSSTDTNILAFNNMFASNQTPKITYNQGTNKEWVNKGMNTEAQRHEST